METYKIKGINLLVSVSFQLMLLSLNVFTHNKYHSWMIFQFFPVALVHSSTPRTTFFIHNNNISSKTYFIYFIFDICERFLSIERELANEKYSKRNVQFAYYYLVRHK